MKEIKQQKADWLRSEIEKFERVKRAYISIITRYKEELKELESK